MRTRRHLNRRKGEREIILLEDSDEELEKARPVEVEGSVVLVSKNYSVSVCLVDLRTLEHEMFLNDIIIDFYLNYLQNEVLPPDDRAGVFIYSTMFFVSLTADKKNQEKLPAREKRHLKVASWTKSVDIFSKNILIFPICTNSHWFLIVVIKPGLVTTPDETNNNGEPLLIVLDSLGGSKTSAVKLIREYLAEEWRTRMSPSCGGQTFQFSAKQMRTMRPKKVRISTL